MIETKIKTATILNIDCMEYMRRLPDKHFDLAVCDPPYGIGENGDRNLSRGLLAVPKNYKSFAGEDKEPPSIEYFLEIQRSCKNQIIFGANHFIDRIAKPSSCWIVWDKDNGETDFADSELAWTSFNSAVRNFRFRWNGMLQGDMKNKEYRIHPTQKPVKLYEWILTNYAKPGQTIFDSHMGSGSSAIAAINLGFEYVGCELDMYYYESACKRITEKTMQERLFL